MSALTDEHYYNVVVKNGPSATLDTREEAIEYARHRVFLDPERIAGMLVLLSWCVAARWTDGKTGASVSIYPIPRRRVEPPTGTLSLTVAVQWLNTPPADKQREAEQYGGSTLAQQSDYIADRDQLAARVVTEALRQSVVQLEQAVTVLRSVMQYTHGTTPGTQLLARAVVAAAS